MLTPLEIQNKVFKKSTFGYAKDDVEEFFRQERPDYVISGWSMRNTTSCIPKTSPCATKSGFWAML